MSVTTTSGPEFKRRLDSWLAGPLGVRLLQTERECVNNVLANLFGYHIAQVGQRGGVDWLAGSRILGRIYLDIDNQGTDGQAGSVRCETDMLPIASDSVDVVVLPHILEFEAQPHQVLREIERVLIGEGYIVIVGFNPWSFWGLWRVALSGRDLPPWCGRFRSTGKLHDWLRLLGLEILDTRFLYHRPPLRNQRLDNLLAGWERFAAAYFPLLGGSFILVGKKRVVAMTPVANRWQRRSRLLASGFAEPSTRSRTHRSDELEQQRG